MYWKIKYILIITCCLFEVFVVGLPISHQLVNGLLSEGDRWVWPSDNDQYRAQRNDNTFYRFHRHHPRHPHYSNQQFWDYNGNDRIIYPGCNHKHSPPSTIKYPPLAAFNFIPTTRPPPYQTTFNSYPIVQTIYPALAEFKPVFNPSTPRPSTTIPSQGNILNSKESTSRTSTSTESIQNFNELLLCYANLYSIHNDSQLKRNYV